MRFGLLKYISIMSVSFINWKVFKITVIKNITFRSKNFRKEKNSREDKRERTAAEEKARRN